MVAAVAPRLLVAAVFVVVVVVAGAVAVAAAAKYEVVVQRVNAQRPLFTKGDSIFDYNYNPTVAAPIAANGSAIPGAPLGLLVRCQNNATGWSVTPSNLAYAALTSPLDGRSSDLEHLVFAPIAAGDVVVAPDGPADNYGDEDPRVVYRAADGLYYLLYSAVATQPQGGLSCKLSLATSPTPSVPRSWTRHGPVLPALPWSKSGALLIRDDVDDAAAGKPKGPHYLFFGDSSKVDGLQYATVSDDLLTYTLNASIWLPMRDAAAGYFDSALVEAGPMPLRLSDGNYLMLYNSARHGYPSPKPNWDLQYNVGFAILDGADPTRILQRSDTPIFSPQLDWEVGNHLLTPNVVFAEGWYPVPGAPPNTFLMFYGAADTYVGAAVVSVFIGDD